LALARPNRATCRGFYPRWECGDEDDGLGRGEGPPTNGGVAGPWSLDLGAARLPREGTEPDPQRGKQGMHRAVDDLTPWASPKSRLENLTNARSPNRRED